MKKIFQYIFIPHWSLVWSQTAHYRDVHSDCITPVFYFIYYSKIRNKYKLVCKGGDTFWGTTPQKHQFYMVAIEKLEELRRQRTLKELEIPTSV